MESPKINEIVWQIVAAIPRGKIATYGQVARLAGYPNHARFVGTTLKKLPKGTRLPWYRVINAKGEISFPQGSAPYKRQQTLLESEGVVFNHGRVSLKAYGWDR